jgi:hypothetical protein
VVRATWPPSIGSLGDEVLPPEAMGLPVVFFAVDLGMWPSDYEELLGSLAADGYLVVCVPMPRLLADHRYLHTCNSEGDRHRWPVWGRVGWQWYQAERKIRQWTRCGCHPLQIYKEVNKRWNDLSYLMMQWKGDQMRLLDTLQNRFASGLWRHQATIQPTAKGHSDQFFLVGHGWGGALSVLWGMDDSRISAMVNLNGFQLGPAGHSHLNKPLLQWAAAVDGHSNEGVYFPAPQVWRSTPHTSHFSLVDGVPTVHVTGRQAIIACVLDFLKAQQAPGPIGSNPSRAEAGASPNNDRHRIY